METQLGAKNQKKILNGQGCRTGTDVRTDARTDESEFIGSFRSLKTSGEPKTLKTAILAENGQILVLKSAKFCHTRIFQAYRV